MAPAVPSERQVIRAVQSSCQHTCQHLLRPEEHDVAAHRRYDVVVAVDRSVRDEVLALVAPEHRDYYQCLLGLITDFSPVSAPEVHRSGGLALLPSSMSQYVKHQVGRRCLHRNPSMQGSTGLWQPFRKL